MATRRRHGAGHAAAGLRQSGGDAPRPRRTAGLLVNLQGGGYSWHYFVEGSRVLFAGDSVWPPGGLHLYADYPRLQIGPITFVVAQVLRQLGPAHGLLLGTLCWELLGVRRPTPVWTGLLFAALYLAPRLDLGPALLGEVRLWALLGSVALVPAAPPNWYPSRSLPQQPVPVTSLPGLPTAGPGWHRGA